MHQLDTILVHRSLVYYAKLCYRDQSRFHSLSHASTTQFAYKLFPLHCFVFFSNCFSALLAVVNSQEEVFRVADPDPKEISTQVGKTITLMCRFPAPIFTCAFRIPGERSEIKLNPAVGQRHENFRYFGDGLDKGQCGIEILKVTEEMHGIAMCRLDPNDLEADARGNISIIIAKPPQDPRIEFDENIDSYEAGDYLEAHCSSVDGRPAATLSWFLNDKPLGPGEIEVVESTNNESTFASIHSKIQIRLTAEDNNARLVCSASHIGFQNGPRNATHQIIVRFRPVPLSETSISGLEIGNSAVIGPITIHANPRPTIQWLIDGKIMNQGEQNERFEARNPVELEGNRYNVSLQVVLLTLEDTTRSYALRATNAIGTTDYKIRIGGSSEFAGELRKDFF
jgi:CD80-like C2-set immunoglobulin domain